MTASRFCAPLAVILASPRYILISAESRGLWLNRVGGTVYVRHVQICAVFVLNCYPLYFVRRGITVRTARRIIFMPMIYNEKLIAYRHKGVMTCARYRHAFSGYEVSSLPPSSSVSLRNGPIGLVSYRRTHLIVTRGCIIYRIGKIKLTRAVCVFVVKHTRTFVYPQFARTKRLYFRRFPNLRVCNNHSLSSNRSESNRE